MNYYVEGKPKARHHWAGEELGRLERAYATRGNIFSYIRPWESILQNAAKVTTDAVFTSWPHPPEDVAHMVRFLFYGTTEEHCMAHLKELRVRSHVLVGLGRIYAEHLHEAVAGARIATLLTDRAAAVARYEANVRRLYPEERFGGEEGGLSDEIQSAAAEAVKRARAGDSTTAFQFKNASPENPTAEAPDRLFENLRPVSVVQDADAGRVVDHDLQVKSTMANFTEYRVPLKGDPAMQASFEPKYMSLVLPSTFNYMAGGPEYPRFYTDEPETRWRRHAKAAVLDPDRFCKSVARNCLMQMAGHWTTLPIARSQQCVRQSR